MNVDTTTDSGFKTISVVSKELDVPQYVLRFWEKNFTQISPVKRKGGRRFYRVKDVENIKKIKTLLYDKGYTIKGVKKLLRESKSCTPYVNSENYENSVSSQKKSDPMLSIFEPLEKQQNNQNVINGENKKVIRSVLNTLVEIQKMLN